MFTACGMKNRRCCLEACGTHPGHQQAAPPVHYTTSCKKSSALEDWRNYTPKHVELIEIVNKIIIVLSSRLFILLLQAVSHFHNYNETIINISYFPPVL